MKTSRLNILIRLALILCFTGITQAAVLDKAPGGFTVQGEVVIQGTPADVYRTFVDEVGQWWNPDHTFSANAQNLSLHAAPGGCLCERLAGGSLRHLEVIYADNGKEIRLSGGLGPLHELGVTGVLKFQFEGEETTRLTYTYRVGGYLAEGLDSWSDAVDFVVNEQVTRLRDHVDRNAQSGD